ncbi:hypothetical protein Acr_11g0009190 [Actinidia rufa]|uniref:Cystatin domain-containing protein n=1 Tax=Actinidia rufa TaxID=165716 RepID=A0A7J0FDF9_9ERIC|nr:hypothetical protein Acr_11g0009190 [Actinidia rufa]
MGSIAPPRDSEDPSGSEQQTPQKKQKLLAKPPPPQRDEQTSKKTNSDSESEDEDGMTAEQKREGFEVDYFPGISYCCKIRPLIYLDEQPILNQNVKSCSEWAIRRFNSDNNTNYQFVEVLKANSVFCAGHEFYLTFTAKDDVMDADGDQSPVIFQAKVYAPIGGRKSTTTFIRGVIEGEALEEGVIKTRNRIKDGRHIGNGLLGASLSLPSLRYQRLYEKEGSEWPSLKKIVGRVEKKGEVGMCFWRKLTGGNALGFVLLSEGDDVQRGNNPSGRGENTQLPSNLDCTYIGEGERAWWCALSDPSFKDNKIVNT